MNLDPKTTPDTAPVSPNQLTPESREAIRHHLTHKPMKPTITFDLAYYVAQVAKTRQYGHTYVHSGGRSQLDHGDITFYVTSYGRSLQSGGNKYKVLAYRNGKPVPTKELRTLTAP